MAVTRKQPTPLSGTEIKKGPTSLQLAPSGILSNHYTHRFILPDPLPFENPPETGPKRGAQGPIRWRVSHEGSGLPELVAREKAIASGRP